MSCLDDEILEIENYIKTLDTNDDIQKEANEMIQVGMSKGLIYDFTSTNYRGTMFSSQVIKKDEYDEFQKYINRCEKDQRDKHKLFVEEIIRSGVEFSKDEFKYIKPF